MSTSNDDEREALLLAQEVRTWADSREGWNRYEVDLGMRVEKMLNALAARFRRSEARRIVDSSDGPAITQEAIDLLDAMNAEGRIFHADYSRLHDLISMSQPQGEPSDARVAAAAVAYNTFPSNYLELSEREQHEARIRAALRAAEGVR